MAKASTRTVKIGTSKSSGGTMPCNICHGTGRVKKPTQKKK